LNRWGGGIVRNNKSGNISEKGLSKPFFMACDETWPGITEVFPERLFGNNYGMFSDVKKTHKYK
jgi:hypothetical protein